MANYKNIIQFIHKQEGGLGSTPKDSASKNPSPCAKGKDGFPYHTNKGVTWNTFTNLAPKLGYVANCDNFIKMPSAIWDKIYKYAFWDVMDGDVIKNQAIANTFVEFAWGSGFQGAENSLIKFFKTYYNKDFTNIHEMSNFVNELDSQGQSPKLFDNLNEHRKKFFLSLNQPTFTKGWLNRLNAFYILNKPYALTTTTKVTSSGLILIILGFAIYNRYYARS